MKVILFLFVLLVPAVAHAEDRLFRLSLVTAISAHAADMAATEHCLGRAAQSAEDARLGGTSTPFLCTETNPLLGRWSAHPAAFGAVQMGVAALSLWATAKLHETHPKLATAINFGMTAAFAGVAVYNTRHAK
jgi:hypothetical protein